MTNEEIYIQFLKSHRKYSSFKRQKFQHLRRSDGGVRVRNAVASSSLWISTDEGHEYWEALSCKWATMCTHFKLIGEIDLRSIN